MNLKHTSPYFSILFPILTKISLNKEKGFYLKLILMTCCYLEGSQYLSTYVTGRNRSLVSINGKMTIHQKIQVKKVNIG